MEQLQNVKDSHGINIERSIADRAYGSGEILQALIDQNIEPIIPLFNGKSGSIIGEAEGFIYEEENDRYRCLAGNYLVPFPSKLPDGRITYHSSGKICKKCPLQETCNANIHNKYHMRVIRRNIHQKLFEQMMEKMKTEDFRQKQIERFWKMEGAISHAKNRHCLSRAKYRGLIKTQIQAYTSASAQNMKKLIVAFFYLLFLYQIMKHSTVKWVVYRVST